MGDAAAVMGRSGLASIVACVALSAPLLALQTPAPSGRQPSATPPARELPALPPRVPIGGVEVVQTTSTLHFTAKPDLEYTLVATYAFPGRARMFYSFRGEETEKGREIRYMRGAQTFALGADKKSRVLEGDERLVVERDFELRRAAYLWPDGFEWKRADGRATTKLAGELGTLTATLDAQSGRPVKLELAVERASQRTVIEAFDALTWVEERGRAWPASFEGWRAGKLEWRETITERAVNPTVVDSFFAPPDLRDASAERDRTLGVVRSEELPAFASRRVELPAGLSWEQALARIAELEAACEKELAPLGLTLDANRTVELSNTLTPAAVHLRLAKAPASLPAGFTTVVARSGRLTFVDGLANVTQARLDELRRAAPPEAKTQTPYVRIARQGGKVLLVLPLAPAG